MSEDDREIKVTDRRIFTAEGELRDDFKHLGDEGGAGQERPRPSEPAPETPPEAAPEPPVEPEPPPQGPPMPPRTHTAPSFADLIAILAEPIAIYLGDAKLPDGTSAENLDAARLHIDLLEVLVEKTSGNLTAEEKGLLEGLLYQLRLRFVQKSG